MDCSSATEITVDSIDETIFEDFYCLDITLPYVADPPETEPKELKLENDEIEQTFSVFTTNLNNLRSNMTPSLFKKPLIMFSPAVATQQPKPSILTDSIFSPVNESTEMTEIQTVDPSTPPRPETPTDLKKSLVLKEISSRTNQSPLYTPVTSMVSRFRHLALESPYPLSHNNNNNNKNNNTKQLETPKMIEGESPVQKPSTGQHETSLEKVKLVSPLLRSPKFRPISTKLPLRSNSKVNTNACSKKSPTIAQYKANPPINQGSRIPVLKLI